MESKDLQENKFWAGGFLYNPKTREVLLHKRDADAVVNPNKWGLFGGLSEAGETPEECLIREWKEELNITAEAKDLIPLCNYLNAEHNTWRYVFFIESAMKKSEMVLGEGEDFDWTSLDKAFDLDLTKSTRRDLETFFKL